MPHSPRAYVESLSDQVLALAMVLVALLFYVVPWPIGYMPCLLVVAILSYQRLDLALLLVPLFAPAFMQPKHLGGKQFAPSEIFLVVDVVVVALFQLGSRRRQADWQRVRHSPFLWPLLLLLVAATASTLFAVDRHHALRAYEQRIVEPMVFFALLLAYGGRRSLWWLYGASLVGAGVISAGIGLGQFITHRDLSQAPGSTIERIQALYGSPDNLGLLFDRAIPLWFASWIAIGPWGAKRIAWSVLGTILLVALGLTYSRGAWLAVLAGCLLVIAVAFPWGRWVALGCVVLAVAGLTFESPALARVLQTGHSGTVQQRLRIWTSSLHMLRDHPILGIGPDNFVHYYAPSEPPITQRYITQCGRGLNYIEPGALQEPCTSHPHGEFLDFWLSTGLLGLVAYLWLQAVFWRLAWQLLRRTARDGDRALLLGCAGAMLAAVLHGLVDNAYFLLDLATIFWLLCGLLSLLATESSHAAREAPA